MVYAVTASALGVVLVSLAVLVWASEDARKARWLYAYSVFYLVILFASMIIDRAGMRLL